MVDTGYNLDKRSQVGTVSVAKLRFDMGETIHAEWHAKNFHMLLYSTNNISRGLLWR